MRHLKGFMEMLARPAWLRVMAIVMAALGCGMIEVMWITPPYNPVMTLSGALLIVAGYSIWTITDRNQSLSEKAEELRASEERLRELGHFRQQFLGNMSHEFRTPLNAIQGFSQAILHRQSEMSDDQIADYVRIIEKSAHDLGTLTDNVLDLSRLDAQKFELELTDVDFTRLVCGAVGQHSAEAGERNIKLNCDIQEDWIVRTDPKGIKRCLSSLISNALKFSKDGQDIDINVYRRGRRSFVVEVKDNGCGIDKKDLQNIWMVYARSSLTKKTTKIGAGLGLAITRSLMDVHNGFIEIDSEVDKGTVVRLCFPNTMIVNPNYAQKIQPEEYAAAG